MSDTALLLCQITAGATLNTAAYVSQLTIQQMLERHVLLPIALAGSTTAHIDSQPGRFNLYVEALFICVIQHLSNLV